jgi:hypothetical protein
MNFLPPLRRRVTTVLFRRQFDAAGASRRWPATATMASHTADALAARAVLGVLGRKGAWLAPIVASWGDLERGNLVSVLNRVARALVTKGEAFVHLLAVGLGELRLQILPAAQVDTSLKLSGGGSNLGP